MSAARWGVFEFGLLVQAGTRKQCRDFAAGEPALIVRRLTRRERAL